MPCPCDHSSISPCACHAHHGHHTVAGYAPDNQVTIGTVSCFMHITFVNADTCLHITFVNGEACPSIALINCEACPKITSVSGEACLPVVLFNGEARPHVPPLSAPRCGHMLPLLKLTPTLVSTQVGLHVISVKTKSHLGQHPGTAKCYLC